MRVVLFTPRGALFLSNVTRDNSGRVKSGYVENGAWHFEIRGKEQLAKAGNTIVTRWPDAPSKEVVVPDTVRGDYNDVIRWAERKIKGASK